MRRSIAGICVVTIFLITLGLIGMSQGGVAQDATPTPVDTYTHPIIGTWIVDTVNASDIDSPEIGLFLPGGVMAGQGANRVAGGSWEVIDDRSVRLTLVTVADANGVGSYVVVRGVHELDDTGDSWTCECTFTVVGADGTVLDSGAAPASATRLPVQGAEAVGTPLVEVPTWTPVQPEATPEG
jgi:hypothetical protein